MKKTLFLIVCASISSMQSQATEVLVKAKVDKATVYLNGAQLYHVNDVVLPQGASEVVFDGVSPTLQQPSIQSSGKGNFTIMDVRYMAVYPEQTPTIFNKVPQKIVMTIAAINDSMSEVQFNLDELNERLSALQTEKNILLNNRLMKGETQRDTLGMFKDAMDYLRNRLNNLTAETYKLKRIIQKNQLQIEGLQRRLEEAQQIAAKVNEPKTNEGKISYRVIVSVMADLPVSGTIAVNYFVAEAGWVPEYDLRAENNGNKILLAHKARITQRTGVEWTNTLLTLATGTPMQNTIKPDITPAYLGFYQQYQRNKRLEEKSKKPQMMYAEETPATTSGAARNMVDANDDANTSMDFTQIQEQMLQTEYDIKLRYRIPSDGAQHMVAVQTKELKTAFQLSAVPKLDASAYLLAKVSGWENLQLIPGKSRIYFDGTYLGESYLDPNTTGDTLTVSMGRDKSIVIQRKKLKDKTKEKILLEEKTIIVAYQIEVKNTKSKNATIHIDDQIPLSADPLIAIKLIDADKAAYEQESGKLQWDLTLKPNESRKLQFSYEVKIPRDRAIAGL